MKHLKGDITKAEHGIVCQQVNCMLVMGAGLAKQIRSKWPQVYTKYRSLLDVKPTNRLGKCQIVSVVDKELYVANLFGQYNYRPRNTQHTNYTALTQALQGLATWHRKYCHIDFPIWIPYKLGCGLAGGDWEIVQSLLSKNIPNCFIIRR